MRTRDDLIKIAHNNFNIDVEQAVKAVDYIVDKFDLEGISEDDVIWALDQALFKYYGDKL